MWKRKDETTDQNKKKNRDTRNHSQDRDRTEITGES